MAHSNHACLGTHSNHRLPDDRFYYVLFGIGLGMLFSGFLEALGIWRRVANLLF